MFSPWPVSFPYLPSLGHSAGARPHCQRPHHVQRSLGRGAEVQAVGMRMKS